MRPPLTLKIHACFEGWMLRDVLFSYHVAKKWVNHILQIKKIKINQVIARGDDIVHEGDVMSVDFDDQLPAIPKPYGGLLEVIHEDDDLLIVNKPINLLVYDDGKKNDSLTARVSAYMLKNDYPYPVLPAHRIDEETSGIIVFAKHPLALSYLSSLFEEKTMHKVYHALINGIVDQQKGTIARPIGREKHKNTMCIDAHGDHAVTHYEVLQVQDRISRLRITIETGRKHQIRVHLKSLGYPIIGDKLYLGKPASRLMLHARELAFIHPSSHQLMTWVVPEPF